MSHFMKKPLFHATFALLAYNHPSHAEEKNNANSATILPTITVHAETEEPYIASQASSVLKSDAPLFETAQSVTVITREQIDQKQSSTLADALQGAASVVAGQRGRRGWDDLSIRGQSAGDQIFIDGLRMSSNSVVAVELSGLDQIQVLKGPASVNFGQIQPGGVVNLVTKRPQAEDFARASVTYGSYSLKQATFDVNYAPKDSAKGAFRLTGRVADQDDPVDYVYFKNYYISPSYNFDLGDKAELSVLASYQYREYLRHQGAPVEGSILPNSNGKVKASTYSGDPETGPYKADVYRAGWNFKYDFGNDLIFKHNAAVQRTLMEGHFTSLQGWSDTATQTTQRRRTEIQDFQYTNYSIDNSLQKSLSLGSAQHELLVGLDAMSERRDDNSYRCNPYAPLTVFSPQYNLGCTSSSGYVQRQHEITTLQYVGVYLRDRIKIADNWIVNLAGRHDWSELKVDNLLSADSEEAVTREQAFTGNASIMYTYNKIMAPYFSYATSFTPNTDLDANGDSFDPEEGLQYEVGLKLQSPDQKFQGALSWFDLTRKNIVTEDADSGDNVLRGEQRSKGVEAELNAVILEKLKLNASYTLSYFAKITEDSVLSNVGQRLENVAKHMYSVSARYHFNTAQLGWYIGAGLTGMSSRESPDRDDVIVPAYTLYNAEAGYQTEHWGAQLAIRNLFDREYYAGALNQYVAVYGAPRQINFTVNFNY